MKSLSVASLIPNSYFSSPVYLDKKYIILSTDTPVSTDLITRLKAWNYTEVFTDGDVLLQPQEELTNPVIIHEAIIDHTLQEQEKHDRIAAFYFDLVNYMDNVIKNLVKKNELDLKEIIEKVKETINIIREEKDVLLGLTAKKYTIENFQIPHVVNSTIIALGIGDFLKLPPHKLIDLGTAGLLHEIGMIKVPQTLVMGKKDLSPEEKKTIVAHTLWGYRILKNFTVPDTIAAVALEHHERSDGSGYPRKITQEAISLYSRIVAVTCSYETSTAGRPYKHPTDAHKALLFMLGPQKNKYDDTALKALVYTLSVYPLGNFVLLSNNTKGIVYKTNFKDPKNPIVKLMKDANNNEIVKPILVETSREKGITIVRTLKPEEM
jgi:HD-GYP domain-containing protein (c-di-GMP phosphodiesterase class II)